MGFAAGVSGMEWAVGTMVGGTIRRIHQPSSNQDSVDLQLKAYVSLYHYQQHNPYASSKNSIYLMSYRIPPGAL